jgi:hypothetical protein
MLKSIPSFSFIADRISIILTSWTFFWLHAVSCNHMWPYLYVCICFEHLSIGITLCTCIMRSLIGGHPRHCEWLAPWMYILGSSHQSACFSNGYEIHVKTRESWWTNMNSYILTI